MTLSSQMTCRTAESWWHNLSLFPLMWLGHREMPIFLEYSWEQSQPNTKDQPARSLYMITNNVMVMYNSHKFITWSNRMILLVINTHIPVQQWNVLQSTSWNTNKINIQLMTYIQRTIRLPVQLHSVWTLQQPPALLTSQASLYGQNSLQALYIAWEQIATFTSLTDKQWLYQGRIKEERACNLGNIRIHMWAGECAWMPM